MLTGESRFHIRPPRGFEPGSLVAGSKRVVHWTSETWWEWSEIASSPQGYPQQPTPSVVKPEGGPAASVKLGQKSCVRSSGIITLSVRGPGDGSGWSLAQTRPQKWSGGVTNVARQRYKENPGFTFSWREYYSCLLRKLPVLKVLPPLSYSWSRGLVFCFEDMASLYW